MTDEDLDRNIRAIIAREGGWVDDPVDSGGPTNYGITLETWQAYCRATPGMDGRGTKEELRSLTAQGPWVWTFYRWYFRTQGLAELIDEFAIPDELVPLVMDMRTLHSMEGCRAILWRALSINLLPFSKISKDEAEAFITLARMRYMLQLAERRPADRKFVRGWMHRALKAIGWWPETMEV